MTTTTPPTDSTQAIIDRHDTFMSINYGRYPIAIAEGQGCTLRDTDGKTYLDLFAGFGAPVLGHCHPDLVDAVTEQAKKLWHVGNLFHTEPQTRAAQAISELGFGGRSFFCHSGADANESAIKLARLYGKANRGKSTGEFGRYKVISCTKSFHGRSFATMGATANPKVREGFGPFLPGYANVAYNDIDAVKAELDDDTVAIIAEPIQGEGGVNVPDPDYFKQLRALCDEHDLLLICDEVWTGCGRTGKVFAYQHWGIEPDIMTLGKGVGGGLAVGVMCAQPRVAELYNAKTQGGVKHATTLGGNCLSMAVTARIFEVLQRDSLVEQAEALGNAAMERLRAFAQSNTAVKDVRGRGLFIGIELDPSADGAWFGSATDVVNRCLEQGLMINGTQGDTLRIAPPVTITSDELDRGLDQLEQVIAG
ncbi:aspartate aminotransferase family protein [Algisphaera agarilytica]|uniref:Putative acetylornithine/succinylornithine family transaminase n=1 Tax=Algisphaera agarilytica TaxID=1385975 RepID=A0A7X0LJ86_9BACT|nr:acetylornithine/succinylornithine family transaminase [Algisphaera agarilytica]MBB6428582.1 putative acetylornithine/succinylornithine family transaminase [Algisphaera agarilytica]